MVSGFSKTQKLKPIPNLPVTYFKIFLIIIYFLNNDKSIDRNSFLTKIQNFCSTGICISYIFFIWSLPPWNGYAPAVQLHKISLSSANRRKMKFVIRNCNITKCFSLHEKRLSNYTTMFCSSILFFNVFDVFFYCQSLFCELFSCLKSDSQLPKKFSFICFTESPLFHL